MNKEWKTRHVDVSRLAVNFTVPQRGRTSELINRCVKYKTVKGTRVRCYDEVSGGLVL